MNTYFPGSRSGRRNRRPIKAVLTAWAIRHAQTSLATLGGLARTPFGTLTTAAVIGIALALPTGLHVLLKNAQQLSRGWDGSAQVSVFLDAGAGDAQARSLGRELSSRPEIGSVRVVTRAEALDEYRRLSGFEDVLEAFAGENPLPPVLVLRLAADHSGTESIQRLLQELEQRSQVDIAQFDLQWVRRLYAITELVQRSVLVLAGFLALGVLLIVGNTIRLGIQNRRDEIEIAKLFGATDAFIRRPFLYMGAWYGLMGGALAWALTGIALELLRGPLNRLVALYYSDFLPITVDFATGTAVLALGAGLGIAGSWLAVGRHLQAIEPS